MRLTDMMQALKAYGGGPLGAIPKEKLEEIRTAPYYAPHMARVRARAQELQGKLLPCIPYSYFKLYDETGSRTEFQSVYHEHRNALGAFFMAALVDGTHIEDLENAIWATCDEYSWCLTAHFRYGGTHIPAVLNPAPRADGKPQPMLHEQPQVIDLCAAQTAADLAEIVALLEDKLAPLVVYRARKLVWERVLQPFMELNTPFWWETAPANWAAVCAGGVGIAAMYLIEDNDMLAPVLTRCTEAMECYLSGFKADGVCAEGVGYWGYGFGHFMIYADLLKQRTGGTVDLFDLPIVHKVALFYHNAFLNNNNVACFSDCGDISLYEYAHMHYLHRRYSDVQIPEEAYARPMFPGTDNVTYCTAMLRNFTWSSPAYQGGPLADGDTLYNDTQWMLSRRTVEGLPVAVAVKGGCNDEPHNHNDVGSFVLDVGGEVLLGDLGGGMYNKRYFSDERYDILVNGSQGHPVPLVNGKTQRPGVDAAAQNYTAGADDTAAWADFDMAAAYDVPELTALRRRVTFCKTELELQVEDTFAFAGESLPVTERLTARVRPQLLPEGVLVPGANATLLLTCNAPCTWSITEAEYEKNAQDLHHKVWLVDAALRPVNGEAVTLTLRRAK